MLKFDFLHYSMVMDKSVFSSHDDAQKSLEESPNGP